MSLTNFCSNQYSNNRQCASLAWRLNLLTDTLHIFPTHFAHLITCISHYMAQDEPPNVSVCALHSIFISSMMCAWAFVVCLFVFVLLLFLSVAYFFSSSLYMYSAQHFISNVNSAEGNSHCAFAQWGVLLLWDIPSSNRLWAQRPWRLRPLRDFCDDLPGRIRRHRYGALVLVWRGTRRWDHRKSAIFTTVHSGARRTSGPDTSLSLWWRKFVASSVLFHTHKNGETRIRT